MLTPIFRISHDDPSLLQLASGLAETRQFPAGLSGQVALSAIGEIFGPKQSAIDFAPLNVGETNNLI